MKGELHIWLEEPEYCIECFKDYISTANAIFWDTHQEKIIHTTQPTFLHFRYGYRLFVHRHQEDVEGHEITLGECKGTAREIREGHNIEKMLFAGEFDWF